MSSTTSTFSTISPLTVEVEVSPQSYNSYTIGQSVVGIIINLMIVIWLKMAFEQKLIYRILMVESVVNLVGLFGFVIIGTSVIENPHNEVLCTCATALSSIMVYNFYFSNLLIACPRRLKIQASTQGHLIPSDQSIFKWLSICWFILFVYLTLLSIANDVFEFHVLPPYEMCLHSDHFAESLALERWQMWLISVPFLAVLVINIYFDYDDIDIFIPPSLAAINQQEHIPPNWDKTPIKTSYISLFSTIIIDIVPLALDKLNAIDLGDENLMVVLFNTYMLVTLLKSPVVALWTHHYYQKQANTNQAKPRIDIELHSITSENQRLMEIESEQ